MPLNDQTAAITSSTSATMGLTADQLSSINSTLTDISLKNNSIRDKQERQIEQLKEIEDKEKLILTRSRMLQISQDRNSYKKKIIYTLIALILFIFIATIMTYVFFMRKSSMSKPNIK